MPHFRLSNMIIHFAILNIHIVGYARRQNWGKIILLYTVNSNKVVIPKTVNYERSCDDGLLFI